MQNNIEQIANGMKSTIKDGKIESTVEQYTDENGLTHIVSEIKKEKDNMVTIERKEWIIG